MGRRSPLKPKRAWDTYRVGPATTRPLWHRLQVLLPGLPRCNGKDACPRCWNGEACARDELVRRLAAGGWGWGWERGRLAFITSLANFLPAKGSGGWFTHRRGGRIQGARGELAGQELADATLGWLLRTFRAFGDSEDPAKLVAWQVGRVVAAGGCAEPSFWEMVALDRARPGRDTDLHAAIADCNGGLASRPADTTASAWMSLAMTRDLFMVRLVSVTRGHEVRHHPGPKAKRPRSLRFS